MTVKELIEELQKLDPDMLVVCATSEDYPNTPCLTVVNLPHDIPYWDGGMRINRTQPDIAFLEIS
jgi:hypothetical protein